MRSQTQCPGNWKLGRLSNAGQSPQLLFGRMHEDWTVEDSVFDRGHIFCIASAGCTAFALAARGHRVTAVDVNPAQVNYVRARCAGMPPQDGTVDRMLTRLRSAMAWIGYSEATVQRFLMLADTEAQIRFWQETLDRAHLRILLRALLSRRILEARYASALVRALPERFDREILRRLERTWTHHPNRTNPYAWQLLLGRAPSDTEELACPSSQINLVCADAAAYLEAHPEQFDGFSLSNILDGASTPYANRLLEAVRRASRPGARMVLRSLGLPRTRDAEDWAAKDRAMIWGHIDVRPTARPFRSQVRKEIATCSTN